MIRLLVVNPNTTQAVTDLMMRSAVTAPRGVPYVPSRAEAEGRDAACVIFGGAPLAGLAARARERLGRPVIDPVAAAVKLAEALVALRPMKAKTGGFARPAAKESACPPRSPTI